jgi:hypothetical protein
LRAILLQSALDTPSRLNAEELSELFRKQILDLLRPEVGTIQINETQMWYVRGLLSQAFRNRLISVGVLSSAEFATRYPSHVGEIADVLVAVTYLNSLGPSEKH